jgi:hypothetical protein
VEPPDLLWNVFIHALGKLFCWIYCKVYVALSLLCGFVCIWTCPQHPLQGLQCFLVIAGTSNVSPYTFSSLGKRIRHSFREKRRSLRLSADAAHGSNPSATSCEGCKQVNTECQHLFIYRLEDAGFYLWQQQEIFFISKASWLVLGPTQPPVYWMPLALSLGIKWHCIPLVLRLRMNGAMPLAPLCAFMADRDSVFTHIQIVVEN